jgi:hypothetical protein
MGAWGKENVSKSADRFPDSNRGLGVVSDGALRRYRYVLHPKMFGSKRGALCALILKIRRNPIHWFHRRAKKLSS